MTFHEVCKTLHIDLSAEPKPATKDARQAEMVEAMNWMTKHPELGREWKAKGMEALDAYRNRIHDRNIKLSSIPTSDLISMEFRPSMGDGTAIFIREVDEGTIAIGGIPELEGSVTILRDGIMFLRGVKADDHQRNRPPVANH